MLTTLPRREWANARDHIISNSEHNKAALEIIDAALFVLVIDDVTPTDIHEAASNMLHGTYNLRSEENLIDYQVRSSKIICPCVFVMTICEQSISTNFPLLDDKGRDLL